MFASLLFATLTLIPNSFAPRAPLLDRFRTFEDANRANHTVQKIFYVRSGSLAWIEQRKELFLVRAAPAPSSGAVFSNQSKRVCSNFYVLETWDVDSNAGCSIAVLNMAVRPALASRTERSFLMLALS